VLGSHNSPDHEIPHPRLALGLLADSPRAVENLGPVAPERADAKLGNGESQHIFQHDLSSWQMCPGEIAATHLGARTKVDVWGRDVAPSFRVPMVGDDLATINVAERILVAHPLGGPRLRVPGILYDAEIVLNR
jgi:hypothetical protein